jgi:hypothetical protein
MDATDNGWVSGGDLVDAQPNDWTPGGDLVDNATSSYGADVTNAIDSFPGWTSGYDLPAGNAGDNGSSDFSFSKALEWFNNLKAPTQSIVASSLFSAISGAFRPDYKKDEMNLLRDKMDLEKRKTAQAATSTGESYDKTKYQVAGAFKPVGLVASSLSRKGA